MKALGTGTWGKAAEAVAHIEAARKRGVQVWADQYPYEASGTSITGALVPRWAQVFGDEAMIRRAKGARSTTWRRRGSDHPRTPPSTCSCAEARASSPST